MDLATSSDSVRDEDTEVTELDYEQNKRTGVMQDLEIYKSYRRSRYLSIKHSSYFDVYEQLLSRFRGRPITFVEIGILNGGSLFMWRDYFGHEARIIGVDLNPAAERWRNDGFEVAIGDQSEPGFWQDFFQRYGDVDVVLDDGGHTNKQQIVTTHEVLSHILDGGVLIVEDVHTSYAREFGNPSGVSFISYAKRMIDSVNSRFPGVRASRSSLKDVVWSITFFESIVCFAVDRRRCILSTPTSNEGESANAADYRMVHSAVGILARLRREGAEPRTLSRWPKLNEYFVGKFRTLASFILMKFESRFLRKYFD